MFLIGFKLPHVIVTHTHSLCRMVALAGQWRLATPSWLWQIGSVMAARSERVAGGVGGQAG